MNDEQLQQRPRVHQDGVDAPEPGDQKRWLGRLIAPDVRDANFRFSAVKKQLPLKKTSGTRMWYPGKELVLDQGATPRCVGFSWTSLVVAGPVRQPGLIPDREHGQRFADDLYLECLKVDEFEGEDQRFGTSVRAGAEVLRSRGIIESYVWAESTKDVVGFVLNYGPVVFGVVWPDSMMDTDEQGALWIAPDSTMSGPHAQGHAICVVGVSTGRRFKNPYTKKTTTGGFKMAQTWGDREHGPGPWGVNGDGFAWLPFETADMLMVAQGECCMPLEKKIKV